MAQDYDLVIRGGTIVDGNGTAPFAGDVAIKGDRIAAIGRGQFARRAEIDAARQDRHARLRRCAHAL